MQKLKNNQKFKAILIIFIIIIAIFYYIYSQNQKEIIFEENSQENNTEEQSTKEENKKIIVHVSGAVNKEGIVELEEGQRVANAIEKAGGVREDAYIKDINYALKLEDGMKIYIPTIKEAKQEKEENNNTQNSNYIISSNDIDKHQNSNGSNNGQKININNADLSKLDELPGIGPSTAKKIIQYREENGNFSNIEELKNVSGIGETKFEKIKELICV